MVTVKGDGASGERSEHAGGLIDRMTVDLLVPGDLVLALANGVADDEIPAGWTRQGPYLYHTITGQESHDELRRMVMAVVRPVVKSAVDGEHLLHAPGALRA